jgi:hypothetical protein
MVVRVNKHIRPAPALEPELHFIKVCRQTLWRVAPVSVTFSNPDEGAPVPVLSLSKDPSPLGTGDGRLTFHRRRIRNGSILAVHQAGMRGIVEIESE